MINDLPERATIALVRGYRYFLSPFFSQHCRFHPRCSAYAIEAVEQHGAAKGIWLALRRIGRCNPLSEGGPDPVPAPGNHR